MPELPEVETTLRGIEPYLKQATLRSIVVRRASLRWPIPISELQSLVGATIQRCTRRAKYLIIETTKGSFMLHLGMSGSLRILDNGIPAGKHDHIDFELSNNTVLRFNDPRRFGCCLMLGKNSEQHGQHSLLKNLGPEPLTDKFNGDYLFKRSRNKTQCIKNFIMDGKVVVGVGNIYASESLFLAGIRPSVNAGKISKARYQELTEVIKQVLSNAIKAGGTTLNDFKQVDGKPGYFAQELNVYGRKGEPCVICNKMIKSEVLGQRNTFYCTNCQKN